MPAPVLVFAIGNESRGDDALGPMLLRELDAWLIANSHADKFELMEEFQLQVEHSLDMKDRRLVLFIDAGINTPTPFSFYRARPDNEPVLYSHELSPEALLQVAKSCHGDTPASFVLCIRGHSFELGDAPTSQALESLAAALAYAKQLMRKPDTVFWNHQCMTTQNKVSPEGSVSSSSAAS